MLDALEMALWQRDRDEHPHVRGELIHHSEAGSQYTSFKLAEHLDAAGLAASIGSVGDAYDNALMESTIGLYKTELIKPQRPWKPNTAIGATPPSGRQGRWPATFWAQVTASICMCSIEVNSRPRQNKSRI